MTSADSFEDYLSVVALRQHYERLLTQGANKFRGYGKELFESGIEAKIRKLDAVIERYELLAGHTSLAPYNFWVGHIKTATITVSGGRLSAEQSIQSPARSGFSQVSDVRICPDNDVFQPIVLPCWNEGSSLLQGNITFLQPVRV